MSNRIFQTGFSLLLLVFMLCGFVYADFKVPAHKGFVTDTTGTLTAAQDAALEAIAEDLDKRTHAQIAVLIVPSLDGEILEDASLKVSREWGVGDKKTSSGLLVFVAKNDRKLRTEVGYGLEGEITDAFTGRVADQVIIPAFKQGMLYQGIDGAMRVYHKHIIKSRLGKEVDSGYAAPNIDTEAEEGGLMDVLPFIIFFAIFLVVTLLGKTGRGGFGGGFGGNGGGFSSNGGSSFGGGDFGGGGSSRDW